MKRGITILAALLLAVHGRAAEPPVEFSGVLTAGGKTKLALTDTSTGITRWVDPGADFNGYVIARYEPREQVVTLRREGQEFRLALVAPKAPEASAPPPAVGLAVRSSPATSTPSVPPPPPAAVLAPNPPPERPAESPAPTGPITVPAVPPAATADPPPAASTPPAARGNATLSRPIQPGDTLETIARTAGLTIEQLLALNPNLNASSLRPGQVVRIR